MTYVAFIGGGGAPTPEWHEVQWLQTSDVADGDRIGAATALDSSGVISMNRDGTICVVGVPNHNSQNGAAYVFTRSGSTWSQAQKLTASDSVAGRLFGSSVAISGDGSTIAVGGKSSSGQGRVYLFTYSGSWSEAQKIVAGSNSGRYGSSVALSEDGTTLAAGASGNFNEGSVYVHVWNGSAWAAQSGEIFVGQNGARFGASVALSSNGNTLAIGSPMRSEGSAVDAGAVFIYTRSGTTWSQQQKLLYPGATTSSDSDRLGITVSLSDDGNTLVAGNFHNLTGASNFGGVSFTRSGTSWTFEADIKPEWYSAVSVTGDGNTAFIGRSNEVSGGVGLYDFMERSAGSWSSPLSGVLDGSSAETDDHAFQSVCIAKDGIYAAAVAPDDDEGGTNRGLIYFFEYS